jgi:general secretion pathway protein H
MERQGHGQQGFTLMEMLLVLVISAMMLTLAPAMIQKAFPTLKLKAAARDMVQEIRYIQNAAIINGQKAEIHFDIEGGKYRSDLVNNGEIRSLPDGIGFSIDERESLPMERGLAAFTFYPDGRSREGEILLGIEERQLKISVDWLTSKVQVDELQAAL